MKAFSAGEMVWSGKMGLFQFNVRRFMRHHQALLIVLLATVFGLLSACEKSSSDSAGPPQPDKKSAVAPARDECPSEPLLRELHATSFHLQHGPVA